MANGEDLRLYAFIAQCLRHQEAGVATDDELDVCLAFYFWRDVSNVIENADLAADIGAGELIQLQVLRNMAAFNRFLLYNDPEDFGLPGGDADGENDGDGAGENAGHDAASDADGSDSASDRDHN